MLRIPFYKPSIGDEEINEVVDTLKSGWLTTGPKTKQFEREFADYLTHKHAIAVNSCTAAWHLALEAIGLKAGQGVIVPTMTFAATAEVVRYFGARPILTDCRIEDLNLDLVDAGRRMTGVRNFGPDRWLDEGDQVSIGYVTFDILHCPGHSLGSVVFFNKELRFAHFGDVLFAGSVGRTDLPGGSHPTLIQSIKEKLLPLGDDVGFICGHGAGSSIGQERMTNPFLTGEM